MLCCMLCILTCDRLRGQMDEHVRIARWALLNKARARLSRCHLEELVVTPTPPPSSPPGDGFVFPLHTNSRSHTRQNCLTRSCVSTTDTCSSNRTQFSSPHIVSSLHGRHSDTISPEFHRQSTLNRFGCLWSLGRVTSTVLDPLSTGTPLRAELVGPTQEWSFLLGQLWDEPYY